MKNIIAYLFDIDGVLTDPSEKKVTEEGLFDQIIGRLKKGEPVGLITGRSNVFIKDRVINKLIERIDDKTILNNLVAVGEMGGTWMTVDAEGHLHEGQAQGLAIAEGLKQKVRELVESKYKDSMFFDETKTQMMTVEMNDGHNLDEFHKVREEFVKDLEEILAGEKFKVDSASIATDIEDPHLGKALAAERFLQFVKDRGINPGRFVTFGDSKSDFEMADELARRGKKVEMVYVGDKAKLGEVSKDYPIEYIGGFTQGTLEYLSRQF